MLSGFLRRSRAALRFSPVLATALLTAAIFLLPATSDHRQARASVADVNISTPSIPVDGANRVPSALE